MPMTNCQSHGTAHNVQESLKITEGVDFKLAQFDAKSSGIF
jgi:hypothetical protein